MVPPSAVHTPAIPSATAVLTPDGKFLPRWGKNPGSQLAIGFEGYQKASLRRRRVENTEVR